jgi:hypothetical protein
MLKLFCPSGKLQRIPPVAAECLLQRDIHSSALLDEDWSWQQERPGTRTGAG